MTKAEIQEICKKYNVVYKLENKNSYRNDTLWLNDLYIGEVEYFNNEYSVYDLVHCKIIDTKELLKELLVDKILSFKKFKELKRIQKMKRDFDD